MGSGRLSGVTVHRISIAATAVTVRKVPLIANLPAFFCLTCVCEGSDCDTHYQGTSGQNQYLTKLTENKVFAGPITKESEVVTGTDACVRFTVHV